MELALRLSFDPSSLARYDREFNPFATVHTTDVKQGINITEGMASKRVPFVREVRGQDGKLLLEAEERVLLFPNALGKTESRDQGETSRQGLVPIRDPCEDICVRVYVHSLHLDDSKDSVADAKVDGEKPYLYTVGPGVRPIVVFLGQVNMPAHVLLRFLISDGTAALANDSQKKKKKGSSDDDAGGQEEFPSTRLKQELVSVATKEGVEIRIDALRQGNAADRALAATLEAMDPEKLMVKGIVHMHASLRATTPETQALTLEERLDLLEDFYISKAPVDREMRKHHKRIHMETASQAYDKYTARENELLQRAWKRYQQAYDEFWETMGDGRLRFGKTVLAPDAPHMARFRLPFWLNGADRLPFAEWWLRTLPQNAPHLPRATLGTERFLRNTLEIGINHMGLTVAEFSASARDVLQGARNLSQEQRSAYLDRTSKTWGRFVRCLEALFAALMAPAHACRYSSDGRYVNALYRLLRVDVETPQHDTAAGVSDDGDCEDLEKLMIIIWAILITGRDGGELGSGGRGWSDSLVATARHLLQHYCDFNTFGSVRGAQLADASPEDEEGIIGTAEDLTEDIGGHMYATAAPLSIVARRYNKNRAFVQDCLDDSLRRKGVDLGEIVTRHFEDNVLGQWSQEGTPERAFLRALWNQAPCVILEMTGRQEPLMMPLEHYFGLSEETLQRIAERASMIEVLQRWPRPQEHKHRHSSQTLYQEQMRSMGNAAPYMFQKRILVRDSYKNASARHLTGFGRRSATGASYTLNCMNKIFGHLYCVCPSKKTHGPPVRLFLDNNCDDAVYVPVPTSITTAYLLDENGQRSQELEDAFMKVVKRFIPYSSFPGDDKSTASSAASALAASSSSSSSFVNSGMSFGGRPFLCHDHSKDVLSRAHPAAPVGELVVRVPPNGAVAETMRKLYGPQRREWATTVRSRIISQGRAGITSSDQIEAIWRHVSSGAGIVGDVKVYTERVAPWFSDSAFASFERRVRFIVDEHKSTPANIVGSKHAGFYRQGDTPGLLWRISQFIASNGIDESVITPERFLAGYHVELEHGKRHYADRLQGEPGLSLLNVTDDEEETTFKIALAHLVENPGLRDGQGNVIIPDYYEALHRMETDTNRLWALQNIHRPSAFTSTRQQGGDDGVTTLLSFAQTTEASLLAFGAHNL